eukprot:TRINITY_DN4071_c1_g1_i1.p1 TRINITY_DN4071_c1_g1~~TRINITY_DN4071_c1_g1_i1.p1  ORF type:complete len:436 (-),score=112.07 TRINITY_DN4071_c1_g1_i1:60-1367(-)
MEFQVTGTNGIPESGVLSVRAGTIRRQLPLTGPDGAARSLRFPKDVTSLKVEVLELLGRGRVQFNSDSVGQERGDFREFFLPVENVSADSQRDPMEVSFVIRNTADNLAKGLAEIPLPELSDREEAERTLTAEADRLQREEAGMEYLEEHGVRKFLEHCVHALMKDRPVDPYLYLQTQIALRVHGHSGPLRRSEAADKRSHSLEVADALQKQVASLSRQLGLIHKEFVDTKDALTDSNARLQALEEASSKAEAAPTGIALESLPAFTEAQKQLQELQTDKVKLEMSLSAQKQAAEAAEAELARKQAAEAALTDQVAQSEGRSKALEAELAALKEQLSSMRAEMAAPPPAVAAAQPSPPLDVSSRPASPALVSEPGVEVVQLPDMTSIKEIALAQEDVSNLAKENAVLVDELTRMRNAIAAVRSEIGTMQGGKASP